MAKITVDAYNAIAHGYLPAPHRKRGERGRFLWHYPPRFREMLDFYREMRRSGYRGDALHFAMWWKFGHWHEKAKAWVERVSDCFARVGPLLLKKIESTTPDDSDVLGEVIQLISQMYPSLFRTDKFRNKYNLEFILDDCLKSVKTGEALDEVEINDWAEVLFHPNVMERMAKAHAFKLLPILPELLRDAARAATKEDYARARETCVEMPHEWATTRTLDRDCTVFAAFCIIFARLFSVRSTEGRILRPLKRAPDLALVALILANRLAVLSRPADTTQRCGTIAFVATKRSS